MNNKLSRETGNQRVHNVKSINQALGVLNGAAQESSEEIKKMINKDFKQMRESLSELKPEIKHVMKEIRDVSSESVLNAKKKIVTTASQMNTSVHKSPWYFIGGSMLFASVLGFFLGRKSK